MPTEKPGPTEEPGPTDTVPTAPAAVLRPATTEDLPGIAELYLRVRAAAVPQMPPIVHTPAEVHAYVARWQLERPDVWVAEGESGDLSAFARVQGAWLESLYVDPRHQATGIGEALLDLVKAIRPAGFALWVFAANASARGFYARRGLIELEHTDGSANEEQSPDLRMAWPGTAPVDYLRDQIDEVDDELSVLLARRSALTAAVQEHKEVGGREGRDPEREREIADRMSQRAPGLGGDRIGRVMDAVITESLDAWEARREASADGQ